MLQHNVMENSYHEKYIKSWPDMMVIVKDIVIK